MRSQVLYNNKLIINFPPWPPGRSLFTEIPVFDPCRLLNRMTTWPFFLKKRKEKERKKIFVRANKEHAESKMS